jgi:hypothetical protein
MRLDISGGLVDHVAHEIPLLALGKASFTKAVKITGGTENDVFNDNANIYVVPSVFTQ